MKTKVQGKVLFCILIMAILGMVLPAHAQKMEYLPDGIFDVESYYLANGMRVTLKKTRVSKNVEFRMQVHYGLDHEPCGDQELPHLLEHLVFTKANGMNEVELERYLIELGTSSNATTSQEYTTYETNVFNEFDKNIIDYFSWILFNTELTEENFRKSVDIVHRESRGEPNWFYDAIVSRGYLKSAYQLLMEDLGIACAMPDYADKLTLNDVLDRYQRWYNPSNMHLLVVGDYSEDLPEYIEQVFGGYPSGKKNIELDVASFVPPKAEYYSSFKPFVSQESYISIGLFLGELDQKESFELNLLMDEFHEAIFNDFRVDKALAYSPSVDFDIAYNTDQYAIFFNLDVDTGKTDMALQQLEDFVDRIIRQPLTQERFEKIRLSRLRTYSTIEATNLTLINYYAGEDFDSAQDLKNKNFELAVKSLDLQGVNQLLKKMQSAPKVKLITRPVLDYWQLGSLLVFLIFLLLAVSINRQKHRFLKK